jgi:hypothetical protein
MAFMLAPNGNGFDRGLRRLLAYEQATTAREPWSPCRKTTPPPRRFRFTKDQRLRFIAKCAAMLRNGDPTAFEQSSALIHTTRKKLCLRGWPWIIAQETATDIVVRALDQIGARRPSWIEGQPEYTEIGFEMRIDAVCWQCGDRLPMFKKKFCCGECQRALKLFLKALYETDKAHGAPPWTDLAEAAATA